MKRILLLIGFTASLSCYAQEKVTEYRASNNITYKIGDTVKLGFGKGTNGRFLFLGSSLSGDKDSMADRSYSNLGLVIKKMKFENTHNVKKMVFIVPSNTMFNYSLSIEDAIKSGEVRPGRTRKKETGSTTDEILKLKKLLDTGTITQSEFDAQKKKLLR